MKKQLFLFVLLLSSIGMSAFEVDGIYYNVLTTSPDYTVEVTGYNSSYEGDLVINGTVTYAEQIYKVVSIKGGTGSGAFSNCSKSITINNLPYCTSIGNYAFYRCSSLTTIGDLSACTSIGSNAFNGCSSLASVGDLSACTSIRNHAFNGCSSLASVGDLSVCTSIGSNAFSGCYSLTSVGDLSACTSIGNSAFSGCSSLASIGDLSVCTSIGNYVFNNCVSLASIGDLSACTSIGSNAFKGIEKVTISNNTPPTLTGAPSEAGTTFLVPAAALEAYRSAEYWHDIRYQVIAQEATHDYDVNAPLLDGVGAGNLTNVMTLKVTGDINSEDIMFIRNNMVNLHHLDLTDANFVASTEEYASGKKTADNSVGGLYGLWRLRSVKLPKSAKSIEGDAFCECI
jgi:hypothetical protein